MQTGKCFALLFIALILAGCKGKEALPPESTDTSSPRSSEGKSTLSDPLPSIPRLAGFVPSAFQIERSGLDKRLFALTFDAGSDAKAVSPILAELKRRNVKATFFLTGKFCERYPKECKAIADTGMEIGNHSYSHPQFTKLSDADIKRQLERAETAIRKACGRGAKPLFRFPYGAENAHVRAIVARCGYQSIYWSLDSQDAFREEKSANFVVNRYAKKLRGGQISLMHVSSLGSAHALPRVFAQLEKLGLKQVPVSEIVRDTILAKREKSRANRRV